MRSLSWAIFVHAPLVSLGVAALVRRPGPSAVAALAGLVVAGIGVDAFLVEPRALEVNRVAVHSPKLGERLTVAVISDIQVDAVGDYERAALARVAEAKPDLVLFTGDYVQVQDHAERAFVERQFTEAVRAAGLHPRLGAYAVQGNAEWGDWERLFAGTGVTALTATRSFDAGPLRLTGLTLDDSFDHQLHLPASERFQIAFGHGPDFALGAVEADLLVAGHTHGGQVQLPGIGPLLTLSGVPREWASGVTALERGRTLVVSRGVGMERNNAPRLRFRCKPEVVLIELEPG
jgi:predicted MPP superfamily phosphohydrolase